MESSSSKPTSEDPAWRGITAPLGRRRFFAAAGAAAGAALLAGQVTPAAAAAMEAGGVAPLPIPAGARGPAIPAEGYLVLEVGDRLFVVTDGIYQMMFLVSDEGVIAVDAPPTIGNNIIRAIAKVTRKRVTHVVYSHSHADHIGAAVLYPDRAERIAHVKTDQLLRAVRDANRPLPTRTFRDQRQVRSGDQVLQLDYRGPNHSPDNIFVYAPRQQVLLLIDVIFPGWVPFRDLAVSEDIPAWIGAHDQALKYPFRTLVAGHLTRLGTRQDVMTQVEYLDHLRDVAEDALLGVDFGEIIAAAGSSADNPWVLFDAYLDEVTRRAGAASTARWGGVLGGADVFAVENAFAMAESLRIDYGVLGPFGIRP